jgi:hypothetical protein
MKIDLTDREIELLMICVGTNIETIKRRPDSAEPMNAEMIEELFELETDLRELVNRQDDGWGDLVICDAETRMFNTGVDAREQMKAGAQAKSRAQERRQELLEESFKPNRPARKQTATQRHDLWEKPANDPADW